MSSSDSQRNLRSENRCSNRFEQLKYERHRKRNKVKKFNIGFKNDKKTELFDAKGIHINSGQDLCDCLNPDCSGCFFKCPNKKCKSNKCGPDCRQKRKYYYESIEDSVVDAKRINKNVIKYEKTSDNVHYN